MGEYKPLPLKRSDLQQRFDIRVRKRSLYAKLKPLVRQKESLPISSLSLPVVSSGSRLAISSGTKVWVHDFVLDANYYSYTGATSFIRSTAFRSDSKLLLASDDSGVIHLLATTLKSLLCRFTEHRSAVYSTCFSYDKAHMFSGSDDGTAKYWDITQSKCITTFLGHSDRVRSVATQSILHETNVLATGGYDSAALLFDIRTPLKPIFQLRHESPINCVNFSADCSVLVTAGADGYVNLYDVASGYKLMAQMKAHTKAVTNAFLLDDLLVTSSLDSTVKFIKYRAERVEHIFYAQASVMALAIALDGKTIAYGTENGEWCLRQRKASVPVETSKARVEVQRYNPGDLSRLDRLLKTFQYKAALDIALDLTLGHVLSLIEELIVRGGLEAAVTRTDEHSIAKILNFINRHFGVNHTSLGLLELLDAIIERNKWISQSNSVEITDLLVKIKQKLGMELHHRQIMHKMLGAIEFVLSHATN
ncbi:U3 small nucleolar RNA-associated protein 15 homolog [Babesia microti strain RI]|uniref:U3 small nucleolar RNA-associated protein 15 homolog n=1 Tax=Babesia microti (strain RI) TaxID=1133968 RepID=A0A1N6LW42_BABMR|nr:U3 small nucleolar RNA-associated protein 15 homolog [Babesia microti strain RI]SIO73125.1 U3 small nucleolar RNA-associated protein 15 homolog [Babesia microti strain RI]|eukprot:XP_021337237.1 U3 small nucleolar RNA-associated protein 15 homolog [Babesia microti strain RI]